MAVVLIRMRLAVLRHSLRDAQKAFWVGTGALLGLALAVLTIVLGYRNADLLGGALALWTLGWVLGPVFTGGGDESLRPEYFTMLPLRPRRMVYGLLAASFAGVAPLVSLLALLGLVARGAATSPAAALLAVPAAGLQLLGLVLLSRVTMAVLGLVLRSRTGAVLAGIVNALILALAAQGWAVVAALGHAGNLRWAAVLVRVLPSGWGLVAVESAGRSDWRAALGALAALVLLSAVLFALWTVLLPRRTSAARRSGTLRRALPVRAGATGAVVAKELRTWTRDLVRTHLWTFSLCYGLFFCLLPLAIGWRAMVPWAGAIFAAMAAGTSGNLYGSDGTVLWLTAMAPGTERADVRGRQRAWLLAVGPVAVVVTVLLTAASGQSWAWPYVLSVLPAVLGGAAGLVVLVSVWALVPVTDPHRRAGNPLALGDNDGGVVGLVYLMLLLVGVTAAPAFLAALAGGWLGVPVGIVSGAASTWGLGTLAHRRLRTRGPELLTLMRHGPAALATPQRPQAKELPRGRRLVFGLCVSIGWLPLFPQGVVPMVFTLNGSHVTSWFLAMHVPDVWRWPVIAAMLAAGITTYGTAGLIWYRHQHPKISGTGAVHEVAGAPGP